MQCIQQFSGSWVQQAINSQLFLHYFIVRGVHKVCRNGQRLVQVLNAVGGARGYKQKLSSIQDALARVCEGEEWMRADILGPFGEVHLEDSICGVMVAGRERGEVLRREDNPPTNTLID